MGGRMRHIERDHKQKLDQLMIQLWRMSMHVCHTQVIHVICIPRVTCICDIQLCTYQSIIVYCILLILLLFSKGQVEVLTIEKKKLNNEIETKNMEIMEVQLEKERIEKQTNEKVHSLTH